MHRQWRLNQVSAARMAFITPLLPFWIGNPRERDLYHLCNILVHAFPAVQQILRQKKILTAASF